MQPVVSVGLSLTHGIITLTHSKQPSNVPCSHDLRLTVFPFNIYAFSIYYLALFVFVFNLQKHWTCI